MKPKVDFCFKELMTDPEVRRGFISALLGVKPEEIVHTELLPTFLRKEHKEDKPGILDVRVQVQGRGQMDMEIQVAPFELWNWAKFFDAECKEEFELAANTDPYITKAYEKLMHISADDEKRLEYEAREKAIRDYNWQMKSNWRNGHKEGKEEGRKEGVEALILTLQELSLSRDAVAEKLQERFELSGQQAEEYVNLYWRN